MAVSDPTYMEVGERGGGEGKAFQLKENEAYMQEAMPSSSKRMKLMPVMDSFP